MDVQLVGAELPKELDYSVPERFLETKFPRKTLFNPGAQTFIEECRPFGLNWALVWSMSYVLTTNFSYSTDVSRKDYFALINPDNQSQQFRTWSEGVRAGVQTIAALMKLPNFDAKDIVWPITEKILFNGKAPYSKLEDFDFYWGPDFAPKVQAVYLELLSFAKGETINLPNPVVVGPETPKPLPIPAPLPPASQPVPVPAPDNGALSSWQVKLGAIAATVGGFIWIAKIFLPGPVDAVIDAVMKAIDIVAHMHF